MKKSELYFTVRFIRDVNLLLCAVCAIVALIVCLTSDVVTYARLLMTMTPAGLLQVIYEAAFLIVRRFCKPNCKGRRV